MRSSLTRIILALGALLLIAAAPADGIAYRVIEGAGRVPLVVAEAGPTDAPAILLIHGFGQSSWSWRTLMRSGLAQRYRLVAFDLRGHGESGKPWDPKAYLGAKPWGDDVARVIAATGLKRPVIVGWSFGGYVAMDYVRGHGEGNVAGIALVGSLGGLALRPQRAAAELGYDAEVNYAGAVAFARILTATPMPPEWTANAAGVIMMTPTYAKIPIARRDLDNRDLAPRLTRPLLLMAGTRDPAVPADKLAEIESRVPGAKRIDYPGSGHMPFLETPEAFLRDLDAFAQTAQGAAK